MKKTIFRTFFIWEYEKEEKWLNKMSSKGWQLVNARLLKYVFEKGEPNEYIYRLELLDKNPKTSESKAYVNFLDEINIESVGQCQNWIYLRIKSSLGNFSCEDRLHSNLTRIIRVDDLFQYARNMTLCLVVASFAFLLICGELNLSTSLGDFLRGFFTGTGIGSSVMSLIMIPRMQKNRKKIKQYIRELSVNE
ncbi:MAG: DUF2812 domain-containing protein [Bacteroidaceae bacterium]